MGSAIFNDGLVFVPNSSGLIRNFDCRIERQGISRACISVDHFRTQRVLSSKWENYGVLQRQAISPMPSFVNNLDMCKQRLSKVRESTPEKAVSYPREEVAVEWPLYRFSRGAGSIWSMVGKIGLLNPVPPGLFQYPPSPGGPIEPRPPAMSGAGGDTKIIETALKASYRLILLSQVWTLSISVDT